jgi:histone H3/H4
MRRLAHDAQQKFSKESYEGALAELDRFMEAVLSLCRRAAVLTKRTAITRAHVLYAVDSLRLHLPPEIRTLDPKELSKLQRCNPKAPAQQRKRSSLHVEVSETAFRRVTRRSANGRVSAHARRTLHLVAEQHLMAFFAEKVNCPERGGAFSDVLAANAFQAVCACTPQVAEDLAAYVAEVLDRVPALLAMSGTRTIDSKLLRTACESVCPELQSVGGDLPAPKSELVRVCDRILRGRAADKRIAASAGLSLAEVLGQLLGNESLRQSTGQYAMGASFAIIADGASKSGPAPTAVNVVPDEGI